MKRKVQIGIWAVLAVVVVAAIIRFRPPPTSATTRHELFFYTVAINFQVPEFCAKIPADALGGTAGAAPKGYQITYLRSQCFYYLAPALHDPRLCDEVKPLKTLTLDGSQINKSGCLDHLRDTSLVGAAMPEEILPGIMNQIGYNDKDVGGPNHYMAFYRSLIQGPGRAEFLKRAATLSLE